MAQAAFPMTGPTTGPATDPATGTATELVTGKIAYLDCPTGIAGDMCLGAIIDAGLPLTVLTERLAQLGLGNEYQLVAQTVQRQSQVATQVQVKLTEHHSHHSSHHWSGDHGRHLPEIESLIQSAQLSERATAWSLAIFRRLAEAEAAVHGIPPEQVHFHEVGATDAIVDIVGTCIGLDELGIEQLYCGALPVGGGTVMAAHGRLPVPAPAVLRLLTQAQAPIYSNGIEKELVTPTGAAIATTLSTRFGPPPPMTLGTVGYGAGGRELPIANVLRLWIGHASSAGDGQRINHQADHHHSHTSAQGSSLPPQDSLSQKSLSSDNAVGAGAATEDIVELQTQVDDLVPQAVGYLYEQLFAAGALDVFVQQVGMKKNRPGVLITVICPPAQGPACTQVLFSETTTLGVRQTVQQRQFLHRECKPVHTPYGPIHIKVARAYPGGPILNLHPEYEDCARYAREQAVAWKQVYQGAIAQAVKQFT